MKAAGASPREVAASAREADLPRVEAIRTLRSLYALDFAEADEIIRDLEGPQSHEALLKLLKDELGYCECASPHALPVLRDILQAARDKMDRASDPEAFASASRQIVRLLGSERPTGLGEWFVYLLESRGVLYHGFRVTDLYITERGRRLLRAIERFDRPVASDTAADV